MHRTNTARTVTRAHRWSALWLALVAVLVVGSTTSTGWAQDAKPDPTIARGKGEPEAKPPRKVRGRLPAYYSRVVSSEQRDQIYAIQSRFAEQMQKLQAELDALEESRDKEVSDVLTADQKKQVAAMITAARAKRGLRAAGAPAAGEDPVAKDDGDK